MINNSEQFMDGVWNWDCIADSLPGKLRPADIDGIIERNGKFLVIETKHPNSKHIPKGQYITLKRLHDTGLFTVIILYGEKDKPEEMDIWYPKDAIFGTWGQSTGRKEASLDDLKRLVSWWFKNANKLNAAHVPLKGSYN